MSLGRPTQVESGQANQWAVLLYNVVLLCNIIYDARTYSGF